MLDPGGFKKLQWGQRILFSLSDSFLFGLFVAIISPMKSISKPRLSIEIYTIRHNLSIEDFRK
jgi:lipopolysaccharide biosynthesis glycosyltransferase